MVNGLNTTKMVKQNQNENTQIEKKIENGKDITKNEKLPKKRNTKMEKS
ncbi:hypothetical protein IKO50_01290 [bacterium]|nr:hypothetical protein [bacterium]